MGSAIDVALPYYPGTQPAFVPALVRHALVLPNDSFHYGVMYAARSSPFEILVTLVYCAAPELHSGRRVRYASLTMHDLNYFREHLDVFAEMAKKRGSDARS